MEIKEILIDTNAYSQFKRGNKDAIEIMRIIPKIFVHPIFLGELLGGFTYGNRKNKNQEELTKFLQSPRIDWLNVTPETANYYSVTYAALKRKGRPIPTNDLWIIALAQEHNLPIWTYDKHFSYLENINLIKTAKDLLVKP